MSEGSYRSLSFGELNDAFQGMSPEAQLFRPMVNIPDSAHPDDQEEPIFLAAIGPVEVSTETGLVPISVLPIWDVNGYYRAIGIAAPYRATKKQMRAAYVRNGGQSNDYATYAFKRLLDPEFRRHYDRRRLPVDDDYRWEALRRTLAPAATAQSLATGRAVSVRDLFGEDIISMMEAEAEAEKLGEKIDARRDMMVDSHDREGMHEAAAPDLWPFAYYLWGSRKQDDAILETWQHQLVDAFSAGGLSLHVAVGYCGRTSGAAARVRYPRPTREGGFLEIIFLHEDVEPTRELADIVVGTYYTYPYGTPTLDKLHIASPK